MLDNPLIQQLEEIVAERKHTISSPTITEIVYRDGKNLGEQSQIIIIDTEGGERALEFDGVFPRDTKQLKEFEDFAQQVRGIKTPG